MQQERVKS